MQKFNALMLAYKMQGGKLRLVVIAFPYFSLNLCLL